MQTFTNAASLIEGYAVTGVTVPAGIYELERTVELAAGSRLLMPGNCVLRPKPGLFTDPLVKITESDVQIRGGSIRGGHLVEFSDAGDGTWVCDFDDSSQWRVGDLFKNGERVPFSQWPLDGWHGLLTSYTNTVAYPQEEIPAYDSSEWIMWRFVLGRPWFSSFGQSSQEQHDLFATMDGPLRIVNNRAALTIGKFCHDYAENKVIYMPLPGESLESIEFVVPCAQVLLQVEGLPGAPLVGVVVASVEFSQSRWNWVPQTVEGGFNACTSSRLVVHRHATGTWMHECLFRNAGGQGVLLGEGSSQFLLSNCKVTDCYASGFAIGKLGALVTDADIVHECELKENRFLNCGILITAASIIPTTPMRDMEIHNNEIAYCGYSGVCMNPTGGSSGLGIGLRNNITANHIHDVMRVQLDGGGVYSFWPQLDSSWSGNYCHDIRGAKITGGIMDRQSGALYLDQSCGGVHYDDNLFHDCQPWPVRINQPSRCTTRRNKWVDGGDVYRHPVGYIENIGYESFSWPGITSRVRTIQSVTDRGDGTMDLVFLMDSQNRYANDDAAFTVVEKTTRAFKGISYDALKVTTPSPTFASWTHRATTSSQWPCFQVPVDGPALGVKSETCKVIDSDGTTYQYMLYGKAGTTTDPMFLAIQPGDHIKNPMIPYGCVSNWGGLGYDTGHFYIYIQSGARQGATYPCIAYGVVSGGATHIYIRIKIDSSLVGGESFSGLAAGDIAQLLMHYVEGAEELTSEQMKSEVANWMRRNPGPDTPKTESLQPLQSWFDHPKNSAAMLLHL